jgi:5-methyltetrahydropteroyltriglutamate--homocysteine methyltransferase
MSVLVDDVGSFPLPPWMKREVFSRAYVQARRCVIAGRSIKKDDFLLSNFYRVIVDSFRMKLAAGLDVVNYPQHYDMYKQFTDEIGKAMEKGTYVVEKSRAILPEVQCLDEQAKELSQEIGSPISLRVCIVGPMELYLKMVGTVFYRDVLLMFAETVQRFAKNSLLNSKYVKTTVVSLDEPSFGFQEINADKDSLADALEKAFDFAGVTKQIHLHTSSRVADFTNIKNIDVLSFEFGASPKNIESVSKRMLDEADKRVRIGIARTDIDSIIAELRDKGIEKPIAAHLVESEKAILERFAVAREKYGDTLAFVGPDCGLGGWPSQEAAQLLLKATVAAVKGASA